jgi:hypothetical protein
MVRVRATERCTTVRTITRPVKILIAVSVIAALAFGVHYFLFSENFSVRDIVIVRDDTVSNFSLDQEFFAPLVGKNIFLITHSLVHDMIADGHYAVRDFHIRRNFPRTLRIELVGYPAVARTMWLGENYLINEDGYLVPSGPNADIVLPYFSLQLFLPKVNTGNEGQADDLSFGTFFGFDLNDRVAYPEDLKKIENFLQRFREDFGIDVTEVEYFRVAREIAIHTLTGTRILLDLNSSIESQFYKLDLVKDKLGLSDGRVSEIDLRIGNDRVFYTE